MQADNFMLMHSVVCLILTSTAIDFYRTYKKQNSENQKYYDTYATMLSVVCLLTFIFTVGLLISQGFSLKIIYLFSFLIFNIVALFLGRKQYDRRHFDICISLIFIMIIVQFVYYLNLIRLNNPEAASALKNAYDKTKDTISENVSSLATKVDAEIDKGFSRHKRKQFSQGVKNFAEKSYTKVGQAVSGTKSVLDTAAANITKSSIKINQNMKNSVNERMEGLNHIGNVASKKVKQGIDNVGESIKKSTKNVSSNLRPLLDKQGNQQKLNDIKQHVKTSGAYETVSSNVKKLRNTIEGQ